MTSSGRRCGTDALTHAWRQCAALLHTISTKAPYASPGQSPWGWPFSIVARDWQSRKDASWRHAGPAAPLPLLVHAVHGACYMFLARRIMESSPSL
jgi:hypothetical protein